MGPPHSAPHRGIAWCGVAPPRVRTMGRESVEPLPVGRAVAWRGILRGVAQIALDSAPPPIAAQKSLHILARPP